MDDDYLVTTDVPVGDDIATQIKKGTTIYIAENVPAFVLNGTVGCGNESRGIGKLVVESAIGSWNR